MESCFFNLAHGHVGLFFQWLFASFLLAYSRIHGANLGLLRRKMKMEKWYHASCFNSHVSILGFIQCEMYGDPVGGHLRQ